MLCSDRLAAVADGDGRYELAAAEAARAVGVGGDQFAALVGHLASAGVLEPLPAALVVRAIHRDEAVLDGELGRQGLRRRLIFLNHADDPGFDGFRSGGGGNVEIMRRYRSPDPDRPARAPRIARSRDVGRELATLRQHHATCDHGFDRQRRQVRGEDEIGAAAGRDRAVLRSSPKCWAVLRVAIWMAVMGFNPQAIACRTTRFMWPSRTSVPEWLSSVQRTKLRELRPISVTAFTWAATSNHAEPKPTHRPHALTHARHRILEPRALVIVGRASGCISAKGRPKSGRGIVAADHLAGALGRRHLREHCRS